MNTVHFVGVDDLVKISSRHKRSVATVESQIITEIRPFIGDNYRTLEKYLHMYYNGYREHGKWYVLADKEAAGIILYDQIDVAKLENVVRGNGANDEHEPLTKRLAEVDGIR